MQNLESISVFPFSHSMGFLITRFLSAPSFFRPFDARSNTSTFVLRSLPRRPRHENPALLALRKTGRRCRSPGCLSTLSPLSSALKLHLRRPVIAFSLPLVSRTRLLSHPAVFFFSSRLLRDYLFLLSFFSLYCYFALPKPVVRLRLSAPPPRLSVGSQARRQCRRFASTTSAGPQLRLPGRPSSPDEEVPFVLSVPFSFRVLFPRPSPLLPDRAWSTCKPQGVYSWFLSPIRDALLLLILNPCSFSCWSYSTPCRRWKKCHLITSCFRFDCPPLGFIAPFFPPLRVPRSARPDHMH